MTRHFKLTNADGGTVYVALEGEQPDPVAPEGGSVEALEAPYVIPPPAVPAAPPAQITRRQLILALLEAGLITGEDALAAATTGAAPAPFAAMLATLPPADALAAQITWASMAVAERNSPLFAQLVGAGLATDADVDALFAVGKTL